MNKKKVFRLSRWVHIFDCENEVIALYHSLNIQTVFLEPYLKKIIGFLKNGTTLNHIIQNINNVDSSTVIECFNELVSDQFVVNIQDDESELLEKKREENVIPVGMISLYLILTDQCNLRCSYCFINNNMPENHKRKDMTLDVAKKAVDIYFSNLSFNLPVHEKYDKTILFYGGEPLLKFNLIKEVVAYTKSQYGDVLSSMGEKFSFLLITNGTLISQEVADFLSENKEVSIAVSLDGEKISHDKERKTISGEGTFDDVVKGLRVLKESSCDVAVSCTISESNIDELGSLLGLQEEFGFSSVNFNTLLDTEKGLVDDSYMEKATNKMLQFFDLARAKGVYEDRIMRKLKSFVSQKIHAFDCQATGNQIVCSPDGGIGVCQEGVGSKQFFYGDVFSPFDFHKNVEINKWNNRTPLNMPQCYDCPAIGICGGGCSYSAWLRNGSVWSVDDRFCTHSLVVLKWLINDLYKMLS
ncbi:radical SAM protein [Patescibacteria group bacterium]|nr:radical SAM protein [Patescibacteria group bacterium]